MEKSLVTEFFLKYFEENQINPEMISEKTGIEKEKLSENYRVPLTASEFLGLCMLLEIAPETVKEWVDKNSNV